MTEAIKTKKELKLEQRALEKKQKLAQDEAKKNERLEKRRLALEKRTLRRGAVRAFRSSYLSLIAYSVVTTVLMFLFVMLSSFIFSDSILGSDGFLNILTAISMYVIGGPLFVIMMRKIPSASYKKARLGVIEFIALYFVMEAAMKLGNLVASFSNMFLTELTGLPFYNTLLMDETLGSSPIIMLVLAVIIGPIVEEIIFRQVIQNKMSVYGNRLAIFVSALAFSLFHANFAQLLYTFLFGLLLGFVYAKTRRIGYCIAFHMILNLTGSLPAVLLFGGYIPEIAYLLITYVPAAIGLVLFVVLLARGYFRSERDCEKPLTAFGVVRASFLNVGAIIFYVVIIMALVGTLMPAESLEVLLNDPLTAMISLI